MTRTAFSLGIFIIIIGKISLGAVEEITTTQLLPQADTPETFRFLNGVALGKWDEVKAQIEKDPSLVRGTNSEGVTALMVASRTANLPMMRLLIRYKADPNAKLTNHFSILHGAMLLDSAEVVTLLIDSGSDVNAQDDSGFTPLANAIEKGKNNHLQLLLARGANPDLQTVQGDTLLLIAAEADNRVAIQILLKAGAKIEAYGENGLNALQLAAKRGNRSAVEALINGGAAIDGFSLRTGATALILASIGESERGDSAADTRKGRPGLMLQIQRTQADFLSVVALLMDRGANLHLKSGRDGFTALHAAVVGNNLEVVTLLLTKGAKVNSLSLDGRSPLHLAAARASPEIVGLLLDQGADMEAVQWDVPSMFTPLLYSVQFGKIENLKLLIARGANPKVRCFESAQATALHIAAKSNQPEAAKILLGSGIPVDVRDAGNQTPLMVSASSDSLEMAEFLVQNGANVHAVADMGHTSLSIAEASNNHRLVAFLKRR
jgi:ankyrin repeat protein